MAEIVNELHTISSTLMMFTSVFMLFGIVAFALYLWSKRTAWNRREQTMDELKSCPFCGYYPIRNTYCWKFGGGDQRMVAEIKCKECSFSLKKEFEGGNVDFSVYLGNFNEVIERWNRRADNE